MNNMILLNCEHRPSVNKCLQLAQLLYSLSFPISQELKFLKFNHLLVQVLKLAFDRYSNKTNKY